MRSIFKSLLCCVCVLMLAAPAAANELYPEFFHVGNTGESGKITFHGVGLPDGTRNFASSANPIIQGNNLYAPDLHRVGDGWYNYFGGWMAAGEVNDRIWLGVRDSLEPNGTWNNQMIISEGVYVHVHDPSVARVDNNWHMVYTAARFVNGVYKDWINYSASADGINWTPSAGTTATEIALADPDNLAAAAMTDIARPALVKAGDTWKMWFDGIADGVRHSYLAESTAATPTDFTLVHRYDNIGGFPALMEPSMVLRPDGTYLGIVQRHFHELYLVTSEDGLNFTQTGPVLRSSDPDKPDFDPTFGRKYVSNPGLLYDSITDQLLGLSFGMTDSDGLTGHDIGFSYTQYRIQVRSPGGVWHTFAQADLLDQQQVWSFNFTDFDMIRLIDPVTNQILLDQPVTAAAGDIWELRWIPEPTLLAPMTIAMMLLMRRRHECPITKGQCPTNGK